jgi:EAL domain-containing protein (putative c-di-GMP-specific phosphodiesterase class I)
VLDRACAALADWPGVTMAINISAVQLREPNLPIQITRRLAAHGIAPARIELEITETALLSPDGIARANLTTLRDAGFRIALDDFGTGYSSLSYLQTLTVDTVKIDQSFVSNLGRSSDSGPIIQAVVHLAQMLNLKVIAEGVETDAQRRFLIDAGCSSLQGFLLSPPLPEGEIGALLTRQGNKPRTGRQDAA